MNIKGDTYENRPFGDANRWAPPKSSENARVVFDDRKDRIADIIFFDKYPKCLRIRLYGPNSHIVCDVLADFEFHPTNQVVPGFWTERIVDTLMRGGIIPLNKAEGEDDNHG